MRPDIVIWDEGFPYVANGPLVKRYDPEQAEGGTLDVGAPVSWSAWTRVTRFPVLSLSVNVLSVG